MTIYDTIIFIRSDNLNKIENLYGKLKIEELTDVINQLLRIALEDKEKIKNIGG